MSNLRAHFNKVAEVELVYKSIPATKNQSRVTSSKDAYEVFIDTWDMNKLELQEQFRVIFLNRNNDCLGVSTISTGGISDCLADPKLVFAAALKARASAIILSHNHPSGNNSFSEPDKTMTERFIQIGKFLDLPVLDHILITKDGYTSYSDLGLNPMPPRRILTPFTP